MEKRIAVEKDFYLWDTETENRQHARSFASVRHTGILRTAGRNLAICKGV